MVYDISPDALHLLDGVGHHDRRSVHIVYSGDMRLASRHRLWRIERRTRSRGLRRHRRRIRAVVCERLLKTCEGALPLHEGNGGIATVRPCEDFLERLRVICRQNGPCETTRDGAMVLGIVFDGCAVPSTTRESSRSL